MLLLLKFVFTIIFMKLNTSNQVTRIELGYKVQRLAVDL